MRPFDPEERLLPPTNRRLIIEHLDAVLLRHDQRYDNLDHADRAMPAQTGSVITTPSGNEWLGGRAAGLELGDRSNRPHPVLCP